MIDKGDKVKYGGKTYEVKSVIPLALMTVVGIELTKGKLTHIWVGDVVKI